MKRKIFLFALVLMCMFLFVACDNGSGKIEYQLSASETHYIVKGIGSYSDKELIIPEEYKGVVVECIGNKAFSGCESLESVTIPDTVTRIVSSAFSDCTNLKSVVIPESVKNIGASVFSGCTSLETVTLPSTLTTIESSLFSGCSNLKNIIIPNTVTSIGVFAFNGCSKLESITIPSKVNNIGNSAFESCDNLKTIKVDADNTVFDSRNDCNAIIEKSSNTLVVGCQSTVIPSNVSSIKYKAFYNCINLKKVTIPDNVKTLDVSTFQNCINLEEVTFNTSSKLERLENYVFKGCTKLNNVEIPAKVTALGIEVFDGCTSLTSIKVNENNEKFDSRNDCNAIIVTATNSLLLGFSKTVIPSDVTQIADNAFKNCTNLETITIPSSIISIGSLAFSNCSDLSSVTFSNTENWSVFESTEATSGTEVDVTKAAQNASNLKGTYVNHIWKCQ